MPTTETSGWNAHLLRQAFVASRPVSWINTAYPFAAAMLLTTREVDWVLIVGAFYYLIPYNLAMYGINDVFDYASDINNPRKGGIEGALLAPRYHRPMLWLALLTNAPFLIVLAAAGGPAAWMPLAVSTFAVVAYSAPVLRFKERPFLDSATSSTHFVSPAVVGLSIAGAQFTPQLWLVLLAFFCWGMAAHAFGAVQDVVPDREARIGSIATVLGAAVTVRLALGLWALAGVLMLFTPFPGPLAAIVALPYLANCAPHWRISDADSGRTNRAWRRFIWLNYGSGALVTMILILWWLQTH
ncbi:prenyltransferase [Leucobacter musarum]|uniref:prenyltransferase n=1 Tax=Leucobacter musarum TaxID=1930747 RepID=UPI0006A776B5|nr:prenyltransferase [Leucobacter musarum]